MAASVWNEIEMSLQKIYSLPHNRIFLAQSNSTPEAEVNKKLEEIKSGFSGVPNKEHFIGPKLFLRVIGHRAYSGEWWFDASILEDLEKAYSRIFFDEEELKATLRAMLREVLAISIEWNCVEEVWALELPKGEHLTGFSGIGAPQRLLASVPLTEKGNRMLVGKVRQLFFPVKNPLWIRKFRGLV